MHVDRIRLHARRARIVLLLVLFLSLLVPDNAGALLDVSQVSARRGFLLTGDVSLSYEREWADYLDQTRSQFIHEYHLTLDGFIRDPRLALFAVSGSLMQTLNDPGINDTYYSIEAQFSFLNRRVLRGPLRYFPQPIGVRFNYSTSELADSYGYGLSLRYDFPGKALAFFRNGKFLSLERWPARGDSNGNNDGRSAGGSSRLFPLPVLSFDYDSFTTKNDETGGEITWDHLSFRAESLTPTSQYRLEYQSFKTTDSGSREETELKSQFLDLRADYHFENREAGRTLDIYNLLSYQKYQDASSMNLSSNGIWIKRFGQNQRDSLLVSGNGRYFSGEESSGYGGALSSSYTRYFSERLSNTLSATLGYGKIENDSSGSVSVGERGFTVRPGVNESTYSALVYDSVTYQFSQRLQLTGSVTAGVRDSAQEYGFNLGFSTFTRPAVAAGYSYYHVSNSSDLLLEEDTRDNHRLYLDLRTMLPGGIYFLSRNYYQIIDSQVTGKQKQLRLRGDLYWNYETYRLNLGVLYLSQKIDFRRFDSGDISTTVVQAVLSKSFGRRLFFSGRASYSKTNTGFTTLELEPSLTWIYRKLSLTSYYTLRKRESDDGTSRTNHRFYFTLTRYFGQRIRPFL